MGFTINEDRGGAIVRLLFLAVLVMVGLDYMDRALIFMFGKRTSPESYAISAIRNVVTSQIKYSATVGSGSYAASLGALQTANLIDSVLGSGTKDGYSYVGSGGANNFTITAAPVTPGSTGTRSFFSDESGVIRYTTEDRPATVEDTPLGQ